MVFSYVPRTYCTNPLFVTLSEAKGLATSWAHEILHFAQNDILDLFCIYSTGTRARYSYHMTAALSSRFLFN